MVDQPFIEDSEEHPEPKKQGKLDLVTATRSISHCACEYGLLAAGVLAVIVVGTVVVRKLRKKK